MSRLLPLLFVVALLLHTASVGAPVPKETKALAYFPDKVGAKWVYDFDGKEETETVTAVKKEDGSILVTVHKIDEFGETDKVTKVTESGIFIVSGLQLKHPPSHVLQLPHKANATWKTWTGTPFLGTSNYTAYGLEEVEVPAGKYKAIRVGRIDAGDICRTYWYAPDVGLVKYVFECGKTTYTRTLKSFAR